MTTVNTLVLTVTVLLTFALVAAGAPAIASAQYLGGGTPNQSENGFIDEREYTVSNPYISNKETVVPSLVPLITLWVIGVAAGGIVLAFFIKGRSGRHATVGKG